MDRGFAWHHSKQPKHARADFEDMLQNNCNAVLIAASEDDIGYWYPNLVEMIEVAQERFNVTVSADQLLGEE